MCGYQHGLPAPRQGSAGDESQADDSGDADKDAGMWDGGGERAVIEKYASLRKTVARMGLERAWDMTPLLRVSEVVIHVGCCLMRV